MDKKQLGRKLNLARKDRGLTSEKLSEICNLNITYVRQIEAGTKVPSLPVFVTFCKVLHVSPSYLLSETLVNEEGEDMDALFDLWKKATLSQLRMITAMVQSALDACE